MHKYLVINLPCVNEIYIKLMFAFLDMYIRLNYIIYKYIDKIFISLYAIILYFYSVKFYNTTSIFRCFIFHKLSYILFYYNYYSAKFYIFMFHIVYYFCIFINYRELGI